jgi:hypothetical protein
VSGDGGGEILIRGGALTLDDVSLLLASNSGSLQGGSGIDIRVDVLTVTRNSGINASSEAEGSAPPVRIRATELVLVSDISYFNSSAFASGDAGSITIQAGELIVRDNALIGTDTSTSGDAGAVTIRAETVRLRNSAKISSTTLAFGDTGVTGDAGAVTI